MTKEIHILPTGKICKFWGKRRNLCIVNAEMCAQSWVLENIVSREILQKSAASRDRGNGRFPEIGRRN